MICPRCGKDAQASNFCPNCGAPIAQEQPTKGASTQQYQSHVDNTPAPPIQTVYSAASPQQPYSPVEAPQYSYPVQPTPPPKKKKTWQIVLIVVGVLLALAIIGNMFNGETSSSSSFTLTSTSVSTIESSTSVSQSASASIEQIDIDTAAAIAETFFSENFENYTVEYDETGFTASVWDNGIAAATMLAQQGDESLLSEWENVKTQMVNLSNSTKEYFQNAGWPDMVVTINLLNDNNLENVLLMVVDGVVVYDVLNS